MPDFIFWHIIDQNYEFMNPIVKNIVAVVAGIIVGGIINMGIIMLSNSVIPLPEGVDPADMQSLKDNMHLFESKHFIMPFLAHAIGTLAGAFLAARLAANNKLYMAVIIGVVFLIGGIMNVYQLPAPAWFNALDLIVAYLPMAWLGWKLTK